MPKSADGSGGVQDALKCSGCGSSNPASHNFCSNCGTKLEKPAPTQESESRTKAQELIEDAFREFERENLGEAILLGEAAVALDTANASAYSLLGTIYDKRGQLSEAIRCFERAVELNPDSAADRERLEAIRLQSVAVTASAAKVSATRSYLERNSSLILVGVATALVVFLIMLPIVLLRGSGEERASTSPQQLVAAPGSSARPVAPPPSQAGQAGSAAGTTAQTGARTTAPSSGAYGTGTLGSRLPGGFAPVLSAEPWETGPPVPPAASESTEGLGPQPVSDTAVTREEPPAITLTFHESEPALRPEGERPTGEAGGTGPAPGLDLWALGNRARTYQGSGMYREAIDSYSRVMDSAPSGRVAQQLAICYQRVGNDERARRTFSRAIDLFSDDVNAGRNAAEARQGIRSCEMGLRILGGGG